MSVLLPPPPTTLRKRTSSFYSSQRPLKAAKTCATTPLTVMAASPLRRTESFLSLDTPPSVNIPYHRTLQYEKEQCERRRALLRVWQPKAPLTAEAELEITLSLGASLQLLFPLPPSDEPTTVKLPYVKNPPTPIQTKPYPPPAPEQAPRKRIIDPTPDNTSDRDLKLAERTRIRTSPLSFAPNSRLPPRRRNKRCKPEADWYRIAIRHAMRETPEGQKILTIGARKAVQLLSATKDLERLVAMQEQDSGDGEEDLLEEAMEDELDLGADGEIEPLTTVEMDDLQSLHGFPQDDWEMVDMTV